MAAKKKASDFNLSAEMRKVVEKNPEITGKEAVALLKKKNSTLNENSASVAFSLARKALGLGKKKKVKKKVAINRLGRKPSGSLNGNVSTDGLMTAKALLDACRGDVDKAKQLLVVVAQIRA